MKELTLNDLDLLNLNTLGPMISLYVSVETSIHDNKTIAQRFQELIHNAEFFLLKDYPRSVVDEYLSVLKDPTPFLNLLSPLDQGIVIFYSKESFKGQIGYMKVQSQIKDLVVVADSFHIKPLIRIKNNVRGFFIVTMSSRAINVLIENQGQLVRIDSYRNEPGILSRSKKKVEDFFLDSAQELNKLFSAYQLPIVLAGVKNHITHMKKHLKQSMLIDESVIANVEKMKTDELTQRVYAILAPYYAQIEYSAVSDIEAAMKEGSVLTYLEDITVNALNGNIKTLFVLENKHVWGAINKRTGEISIKPKQVNSHDDDLLDDLCQIVLTKGGKVVVVRESNQFENGHALAIVLEKSHSKIKNISYTHNENNEHATL